MSRSGKAKAKTSGKSKKDAKKEEEAEQKEAEHEAPEEECEEEPDEFNESEEIPDDYRTVTQDELTENPFGFLFSSSVTQCFASGPVYEDEVAFFNGNRYSGEMHEGIIHGHGTYTWASLGASYTGSFQWGTFTGTGRIEWRDGSSYEGDVVDGVRHGHGIYRKSGDDGFVYEGEWRHGRFDGRGTCYYGEQGCPHHYTGDFRAGLREGVGTLHYPNGNVYEGGWRAGKRHGHGKFVWAASGSYYVGQFEDGEMHGQGEMVYAFSAQSPSAQFVQSNRYLGEFAQSVRSGYGVFYYANGAVYKGEWRDNLKNGAGQFTSRDGRVYRSEFRGGSIYEDGKLFVPTPSISLNFSLEGLLAASESADEVMNSLCNIYVRFLPRLRALYQQYSKIQWADDKTITALRMVGMWRFLQDKGSILDPDFRLSDADDVIRWNLERVSVLRDAPIVPYDLTATKSIMFVEHSRIIASPGAFRNDPLRKEADPFATLFLYQLFEAFVRLAHHRLKESFPDSLILQVTRFLENSILMPDDEPPANPYSIFRRSISTSTFDDVVTKYSGTLIQLYLEFAGYAALCSIHQIRKLEIGIRIDPNVDVDLEPYQGIMTIRDLVLFLSDRGFFADTKRLRVCDMMLFQRFESAARPLEEGEEETFRKFFTAFTECKVVFVEFVQTLAFVGAKLIRFTNWSLERKFEYVMENLEQWKPPVPAPDDILEPEEEEPEPPPPPPEPVEQPRRHSRRLKTE
jgi:hypothetical protein